MPYYVTEPIKIEGTKLGYAIYPYQFSFLDIKRVRENNFVKLNIFELKDGEFLEIEKTVYQESLQISMHNSHIIEEKLKKFIVENEKYVEDAEKLEKFFDSKKESEKVV